MQETQNIKDTTSVEIKNALFETQSTYGIAFDIVKNGDVRRLKELSLDNIIEAQRDNMGNTLLHQAARFQNAEMAKALIDMKTDVNDQNKLGDTPLHIATKYNNLPVVKELLQAGADVNAQNANKLTPLHVAAAHSDVSVLRWLMANGANVNATDKWGTTPLFRALTVANVSELIHTGGAEVNARDMMGNTPLYYAAWRADGKCDVVSTLCVYGADPMMKNNHGYSPLDIAQEENHPELVKKMKSFVVFDALKSLAGQINQKINEIQGSLQKIPGISRSDNSDLQYNMMRALSRLTSVDLSLKKMLYKENIKKGVMTNMPKIITRHERILPEHNDRVNEN